MNTGGAFKICGIFSRGRVRVSKHSQEGLPVHGLVLKLDAVAAYLLEHETMDRKAFLAVFGEDAAEEPAALEAPEQDGRHCTSADSAEDP